MNDPRTTSAAHLQTLAEWTASVEIAHIPPAVLRKAARLLADDLAATIGARDEPEVRRFHGRVLQRRASPEATVWNGAGVRTDRLWAAVANAVAADWLELDEGYRPTPCHGGLYVLPALLAHAEATRMQFGDVLRALVLGYEIVTRVALTWRPRRMTMQAHGRFAAIGAAAGIGVATRLEARELAMSLGAAATVIGPSPRSHLEAGVLMRNAWPASGAWNGMMAIEWANCGITGAPTALHDVYGTVLDGDARPAELVAQLGDRWAVLDGYTKVYACCQHLHSAVEAAVDLRGRHPDAASVQDIKEIRVECHPLARSLSDATPHTTLGAKFSMPHAVAAALVFGDGGAMAFSAQVLHDPTVARLRRLVKMRAWTGGLEPPNDRPARIVVTLRAGREVTGECLSARGGPDRPLPEDAWRDKMLALAVPAYPAIVEVFDVLVHCDSASLDRSWLEIVQEICASDAATAA